MKKTKLALHRESLQQLSGAKLRGIHGGIPTNYSNVCSMQNTCGCPPPPSPTATACSDACSASVSSKARLGQNFPC